MATGNLHGFLQQVKNSFILLTLITHSLLFPVLLPDQYLAILFIGFRFKKLHYND